MDTSTLHTRIGLIADIHANDAALAAVLSALYADDVREIVALGDLVGYHIRARETLALLRGAHVHSVAGNHDLMAVGGLPLEGGPKAVQAIRDTRATLTPEDAAFLQGLPAELRPAPAVLCVHGALGNPTRRLNEYWEFAAEAARLRVLEPEVRICCFGHTHLRRVVSVLRDGGIVGYTGAQVQLPDNALTFINPGTVGYPRDGDKRAAYAILDHRAGTVSFHRVHYDLATTVAGPQQMRAGGRAWAWLNRARQLATTAEAHPQRKHS
ncbi:MAG: metallophosphoesterase family protein [Gemmatimonadales bacterium]